MIFQDILAKYNTPHHASGGKTRPGWINLTCPNCGKDPYLGYNIAGRYANCWSCGPVPMIQVLAAITLLPYKQCSELLEGIPQERLSKKLQSIGTLKRPYEVETPWGAHYKYMQDRGFNPTELIARWRVGGIGQWGGRLRWRLYIPIFLRGQEVSWTTRAIGDEVQPRYISARDEESAIPIENLVYGIDMVANTIILVEGPLDVWAIGPGACCQFGMRTSPAQLEQISRIPNRYVCFDAELQAQRRARSLCDDLSAFSGSTHNVILESGKDPAEASEEEKQQFRRLLQ